VNGTEAKTSFGRRQFSFAIEGAEGQPV
jgi:hypothetical protein